MCHYGLLVSLGYCALFGSFQALGLAIYFSWDVNICRFPRPHWILAQYVPVSTPHLAIPAWWFSGLVGKIILSLRNCSMSDSGYCVSIKPHENCCEGFRNFYLCAAKCIMTSQAMLYATFFPALQEYCNSTNRVISINSHHGRSAGNRHPQTFKLQKLKVPRKIIKAQEF